MCDHVDRNSDELDLSALLVCWQGEKAASLRCSASRRETVTLGRRHIGGGFARAIGGIACRCAEPERQAEFG